MTDSSTKSNEALALLWAYELNRENKHLFKGLKKMNRRLAKHDKPQPLSKDIDRDPSRSNIGAKQQQKT